MAFVLSMQLLAFVLLVRDGVMLLFEFSGAVPAPTFNQ
jgi:hypothetical protein